MDLTYHNNFTIEDLGEQEMFVYDIEVENCHNFFANDILIHNSLYLDFSNLVKKLKLKNQDLTKEQIVDILDTFSATTLQGVINNSYDGMFEYLNNYSNNMVMVRDVIADSAFWTAKKRYAMNVHDVEGVRYSTPELKIMGLEAVKSSTPKYCREKMKEGIRIILTQGEDSWLDFIEKTEREFFKLPVEDIASPLSVSDIDKYSPDGKTWDKGTPINVKSSVVYNRMLADLNLGDRYEFIMNGSKIKYVYLKKPNITHEDSIAFITKLPKEFNMESSVDYQRQWQKTFLSAMSTIAAACGVGVERKNTVDDLFG